MSNFKRIIADINPRSDGQPALDRVRQIAAGRAAVVVNPENAEEGN